MKFALRFFRVCLLLVVVLTTLRAWADVAVLSNRTNREIIIEVIPGGETARTMAIGVGDSRPVFFNRMASVRFGDRINAQTYPIVPSAAYFFGIDPNTQSVRMDRIGLGPSDSQPRPLGEWNPDKQHGTELVTLPIKIAVDDDEVTHRSVWEPRLRERVAAASRVFEEHCGVKLSIVGVATWDSDDTVRDFGRSLREFEREVAASPAALVIGFSSQYDFATGRVHIGGSRGPLHPYILLKERTPNVLEPEKQELLVHETAHYFGASHSPEPQSVMRPLLTMSHLRAAGSRIYFDPVNTLLMSLVSDEMRQRQVRTIADISDPTKQRMLEIYKVLQEALPSDPAALQCQALLGVATTATMVQEVREILAQLTQFARFENARATKAGNPVPGDILTTRYVREGAAIANEFHSASAAKSLLLALGIFMDDSSTLRTIPMTSSLVSQVETEEQRRERIAVMGSPAIRGRRDLAKHFFVSAHLLVAMEESAAESVGLAKEVLDANGGTGFSFADMAANRAGIIFAKKLQAGQVTLSQLQGFSVDAFMPVIDDLAEGMDAAKLKAHLGGDYDANLTSELERIEARILDLPVYSNQTLAP